MTTIRYPAEEVPGAGLPARDLASIDYTIHTVFFGLDILVFAYLVLRSAFLPRIIGVLLAVDGLAYLCYSVTDILAPDAAAHLVPWIQVPPWLGKERCGSLEGTLHGIQAPLSRDAP